MWILRPSFPLTFRCPMPVSPVLDSYPYAIHISALAPAVFPFQPCSYTGQIKNTALTGRRCKRVLLLSEADKVMITRLSAHFRCKVGDEGRAIFVHKLEWRELPFLIPALGQQFRLKPAVSADGRLMFKKD